MRTHVAPGDTSTFGRCPRPAVALAAVLSLAAIGCGSESPAAPSARMPAAQTARAKQAQDSGDFSGIYTGTYTISDCGRTGNWAPCAESTYAPGAPLAMSLSQNGSSVSGQLILGSIVRSVSGTVLGNGHLQLSGSTTISDGGIPVTFAILGWDTELLGIDLRGGWKEHISSPAVLGFIQWVSTIESVTRASTTPASLTSLHLAQGKHTLFELLGVPK